MAPHNPCMHSKWTGRVHTDYHVRQDTPHLYLLVCPALFLLLLTLPSMFQQCRNPSYCEHSFIVNSPSPFFQQELPICFCAINLSVPGPIINPNSHCRLLCETMVGPLNLIPLPLGLMLRRECLQQWRRRGFVSWFWHVPLTGSAAGVTSPTPGDQQHPSAAPTHQWFCGGTPLVRQLSMSSFPWCPKGKIFSKFH